MSRVGSLLTALCITALAAASPRIAATQGTGVIECDSKGGARQHCAVANIDPESVTMEKKLSQANCYRDESWGVHADGIWVSKGCRAKFAYARKSSGNQAGAAGGSSSSAMQRSCLQRVAKEWNVTESNLEVTNTTHNAEGTYEIMVRSKRSEGSCLVDSHGKVTGVYTK